MHDGLFQFATRPVEILRGVLGLPLVWVAEKLDRSLFTVPDFDVTGQAHYERTPLQRNCFDVA
jgi:hypothetical protein